MREWLWRLRAMRRRDGTERDRHDEIQFHFDAAVEAARARGLSPGEAHRDAPTDSARSTAGPGLVPPPCCSESRLSPASALARMASRQVDGAALRED